MSQQQTANFILVSSGTPIMVANGVQNSSTLTVNYTPQNSTQSYSVAVEGVLLSSGESAVLDTVTAQTGSVTGRSISLSSTTYDAFRITATWANANAQFSVAVNLVSTGAGAAYSAVGGSIANIHAQ